ncbi:MAG: peptidase S16 [Gammaproteobacteria bacterium]|nr:MAG: peptidase S16 [Gammaproteobacteria bacterium]
MMQIPLFPLHLPLMPGGPLPLRIFEPRYLSMIGDCLRSNSPFGVALITKGGETGKAAKCHSIGTLARITDWDQGEDGLLHIEAVGEQRFRVLDTQVSDDQLVLAEIQILPDAPTELPTRYREQAEWLLEALPRLEAYKGLEMAPDDANWVAYRLAELLLRPGQRQALLEQDDPLRRLEQVARQIRLQQRDMTDDA